jgi:hypothetical protein
MDGRAIGGSGNDQFYVGEGDDNLLSSGAGADQFWLKIHLSNQQCPLLIYSNNKFRTMSCLCDRPNYQKLSIFSWF